MTLTFKRGLERDKVIQDVMYLGQESFISEVFLLSWHTNTHTYIRPTAL